MKSIIGTKEYNYLPVDANTAAAWNSIPGGFLTINYYGVIEYEFNDGNRFYVEYHDSYPQEIKVYPGINNKSSGESIDFLQLQTAISDGISQGISQAIKNRTIDPPF